MGFLGGSGRGSSEAACKQGELWMGVGWGRRCVGERSDRWLTGVKLKFLGGNWGSYAGVGRGCHGTIRGSVMLVFKNRKGRGGGPCRGEGSSRHWPWSSHL